MKILFPVPVYLKNKPERKVLFIIILFSLSLSAFLVRLQARLGVAYWDIFLYLNNALMFAGLGEGSLIKLPPLLPFITSLFFRLGYIKDGPLYLISGIIFMLGIISLYLLLKLRFTTLESMAGAIIFSSFSLILSWAATGSLDVPAVSLSICLTCALVYGLNKNSRALLLVFPLAFLSFFTRYTTGLMLLPLGFYFLTIILEGKLKKEHLIKLTLGFFIGLVIMVPVLGFFYTNLGNPLPFLNMLEGSVINDPSHSDPAYLPGKLYYLNHITQYVSSYPVNDSYATMLYPSMAQTNPVSYLILIITGAGLMAYLLSYLLGYKNSKKVSRTRKLFFLLGGTLLCLLFFYTLTGNSYLPSLVLAFTLCFLVYYSMKDISWENRSMDMMMVIWFLTYLISHSFLIIKVDRYFITTLPALSYLMVLGLVEIQKLFRPLRGSTKTGLVAIGMAIFLFLSSSQPYAANVPRHIYGDLETTGDFLRSYDPHYADKIIYSDNWPAMSWHLKMKVKRGWCSSFKDKSSFSKMLLQNNATYFIQTKPDCPVNLSGYQEIGHVYYILIYKRISS